MNFTRGRSLAAMAVMLTAFHWSALGWAQVLTPVVGSPFPAGGLQPIGVAVNSAGTLLFVANAGAISVFSISSAGALTPVSGSPFAGEPVQYGVTVNSTDTLLFIANDGARTISVFNILISP